MFFGAQSQKVGKKEMYYVQFLQMRFKEAQLKNSRYSLRSFSRRLGVNVATISKLLRGIEIPSDRVMLRILDILQADPHERLSFIDSVLTQRSKDLLNEAHCLSLIVEPQDPQFADQSISDMIEANRMNLAPGAKPDLVLIRVTFFPDAQS